VSELFLEDINGQRTRQLTARAWFADTKLALLGFAGVLEHATLHIDMPRRDGWIDLN
jgi:hypothetical protein